MSLTYQVGCSVEAVSPVVRTITGEAALSVEGVGRDGAEEMIFAPLSMPADQALSALTLGEFSVVRLRFAADPARWLMVFAPWVDGFTTRWTVTYEQHPLDEELAFRLIEREGVAYVAATEDALDLPDRANPERFPWDDWQLVLAIIRNPLTDQLISRRGPAFGRWRVPSWQPGFSRVECLVTEVPGTDGASASFQLHGSSSAGDSTIWLSLGNTAFPSAGWHDFPLVNLAWWAGEVADPLRGDRRRAQLRFMEGPYFAEVSDGPGCDANLCLVRQLRTGEVVLGGVYVPAEEIGREIHRAGTAVLAATNAHNSDDARVLRASLDRLAAVLGERGRR